MPEMPEAPVDARSRNPFLVRNRADAPAVAPAAPAAGGDPGPAAAAGADPDNPHAARIAELQDLSAQKLKARNAAIGRFQRGDHTEETLNQVRRDEREYVQGVANRVHTLEGWRAEGQGDAPVPTATQTEAALSGDPAKKAAADFFAEKGYWPGVGLRYSERTNAPAEQIVAAEDRVIQAIAGDRQRDPGDPSVPTTAQTNERLAEQQRQRLTEEAQGELDQEFNFDRMSAEALKGALDRQQRINDALNNPQAAAEREAETLKAAVELNQQFDYDKLKADVGAALTPPVPAGTPAQGAQQAPEDLPADPRNDTDEQHARRVGRIHKPWGGRGRHHRPHRRGAPVTSGNAQAPAPAAAPDAQAPAAQASPPAEAGAVAPAQPLRVSTFDTPPPTRDKGGFLRGLGLRWPGSRRDQGQPDQGQQQEQRLSQEVAGQMSDVRSTIFDETGFPTNDPDSNSRATLIERTFPSLYSVIDKPGEIYLINQEPPSTCRSVGGGSIVESGTRGKKEPDLYTFDVTFATPEAQQAFLTEIKAGGARAKYALDFIELKKKEEALQAGRNTANIDARPFQVAETRVTSGTIPDDLYTSLAIPQPARPGEDRVGTGAGAPAGGPAVGEPPGWPHPVPGTGTVLAGAGAPPPGGGGGDGNGEGAAERLARQRPRTLADYFVMNPGRITGILLEQDMLGDNHDPETVRLARQALDLQTLLNDEEYEQRIPANAPDNYPLGDLPQDPDQILAIMARFEEPGNPGTPRAGEEDMHNKLRLYLNRLEDEEAAPAAPSLTDYFTLREKDLLTTIDRLQGENNQAALAIALQARALREHLLHHAVDPDMLPRNPVQLEQLLVSLEDPQTHRPTVDTDPLSMYESLNAYLDQIDTEFVRNETDPEADAAKLDAEVSAQPETEKTFEEVTRDIAQHTLEAESLNMQGTSFIANRSGNNFTILSDSQIGVSRDQRNQQNDLVNTERALSGNQGYYHGVESIATYNMHLMFGADMPLRQPGRSDMEPIPELSTDSLFVLSRTRDDGSVIIQGAGNVMWERKESRPGALPTMFTLVVDNAQAASEFMNLIQYYPEDTLYSVFKNIRPQAPQQGHYDLYEQLIARRDAADDRHAIRHVYVGDSAPDGTILTPYRRDYNPTTGTWNTVTIQTITPEAPGAPQASSGGKFEGAGARLDEEF